MKDQIDPQFLRLLRVLNQATIKVADTEKLLEDVQANLQNFKDIRDKILRTLNEFYPESSKN